MVAGTSGSGARTAGAAGTDTAGGGGGGADAAGTGGSGAAGTGSNTTAGAGAAAGTAEGTSRPSAMALRRAIRPLSSPGGSASVASSTERISLMVSSGSRMAETAWGDTDSSPSRNLPSTFSDA